MCKIIPISAIFISFSYTVLQECNKKSFPVYTRSDVDWVALEGNSLHTVILAPRLPPSWDANISTCGFQGHCDKGGEGWWFPQDIIRGHACSWLYITSASLRWVEPNHVSQPTVSKGGKFRGAHGLIMNTTVFATPALMTKNSHGYGNAGQSTKISKSDKPGFKSKLCCLLAVWVVCLTFQNPSFLIFEMGVLIEPTFVSDTYYMFKKDGCLFCFYSTLWALKLLLYFCIYSNLRRKNLKHLLHSPTPTLEILYRW